MPDSTQVSRYNSGMFLLGIAGGSGSGKTTIVDRILRGPVGGAVSLVPHDAYYRSRHDMPDAVREIENWDHPDAIDNDLFCRHLDELKAGRDVDRPVYNFATHSRSPETVRLDARPVLLVDGLLLFSIPEIRRRLDLKIFVDTPADLRIVRRLVPRCERARPKRRIGHRPVSADRPSDARSVCRAKPEVCRCRHPVGISERRSDPPHRSPDSGTDSGNGGNDGPRLTLYQFQNLPQARIVAEREILIDGQVLIAQFLIADSRVNTEAGKFFRVEAVQHVGGEKGLQR